MWTLGPRSCANLLGMTRESCPDSQQGAVSCTLCCLRSHCQKVLTMVSSSPNSTTKSNPKACLPKCATSAWREDTSQNFAWMNRFVGHAMEAGIRKETPFVPWAYHPIRAPLLTPSSSSKAPPPLASQISQAGPSMSPSEDVWPLPSSQVSQCSSVADRSPPRSPPPLDEARSQEVHTPVTSDGTEENHHKKRPISPTSPSDVQGNEHKREKSEVSTNAEDKNTPDSRPG